MYTHIHSHTPGHRNGCPFTGPTGQIRRNGDPDPDLEAPGRSSLPSCQFFSIHMETRIRDSLVLRSTTKHSPGKKIGDERSPDLLTRRAITGRKDAVQVWQSACSLCAIQRTCERIDYLTRERLQVLSLPFVLLSLSLSYTHTHTRSLTRERTKASRCPPFPLTFRSASERKKGKRRSEQTVSGRGETVHTNFALLSLCVCGREFDQSGRRRRRRERRRSLEGESSLPVREWSERGTRSTWTNKIDTRF